jgi:hypothetical protein
VSGKERPLIVHVERGMLVFDLLTDDAGGRGHAEFGCPMVRREEDFFVVAARMVPRFDIDEAVLSAVSGEAEVVHGHGVRVVPARAGGARVKAVRPAAARPDQYAGLLHGTIFDGRPLTYQSWSGPGPDPSLATSSYIGSGPKLGMFFGSRFGHSEGLWLTDPWGNS